MTTTTDLYPLTFDPIYKEKVWGGRAFEALGRQLPGDTSIGIGESWEIADLAKTSVSGGGGNAAYSVVSNGPLQGKTVRELMQIYGDALLGEGASAAEDGGFPLLIKFLDAKENLSVQVHPSPEYAAEHPDAYLKSEAWYVIDHEPGAVIYKGVKPGTTPEMLRAALETNTDEAVVPLLNAIKVKKGDCHYLPSGTLHALGAGVLVAEVQTPSDTTYRVYDWGRTDRELHIEQAMACIDFGSEMVDEEDRMPSIPWTDGLTMTVAAACEFFNINEFVCHADMLFTSDHAPDAPIGNHPIIYMPLCGEATITFTNGLSADMKPGQTLLIPASMIFIKSIEAKAGATWLMAHPDSPDR
ncbi:MAG: type I phosphomannose isomerase catalytic subunit [Planctomycetota bacterium]